MSIAVEDLDGTQQSTFRTEIGCGDAAALDVGTTAGTVAAGDDSRITGAVQASTYDAHSILAATTDNTPAALTVTEQTVVGRATGGNIAPLVIDSDLSSVSANDDTIPSAKATKAALDLKLPLAGGTMTGSITLGENTGIALDPAGSADEKWSGITIAGTAGATVVVGNLLYLNKASDYRWELADADAVASAGGVMLGICLTASASDGNAITLLLIGTIRSAAFPTYAAGAVLYVGTDPGGITATEPSGTGDIVRIVGYSLDGDPNTIFFNPSHDWIELA